MSGPADARGGGEAVPVKGDMPALVAEDKPAHRPQCRISAVPAKEAVVDGADNLGQEQHGQLEANAEPAPHQAEDREAPMSLDAPAAEPGHRRGKKPRMLAFLRKPPVHQDPRFAGQELLAVMGDQVRRPASVTKLKLLERPNKRRDRI